MVDRLGGRGALSSGTHPPAAPLQARLCLLVARRHGVGEGRRFGWSPSPVVEWSEARKRQIVAEDRYGICRALRPAPVADPGFRERRFTESAVDALSARSQRVEGTRENGAAVASTDGIASSVPTWIDGW